MGKKDIQIQFGAQDSELKGGEYTIPEGMEAIIQDGKVIVRENSENERMIKSITRFINVFPDCNFPTQEGFKRKDIFAWLKKQKENPKSANSIPSDCTSDAKCENIWHKVTDSLPDSAREVLCKDAIGYFFIGRYYQSCQNWEVMMYDDCDKSNEDNPPVVSWCEIPSEKQKDSKVVKFDHDREQKPVEWGE